MSGPASGSFTVTFKSVGFSNQLIFANQSIQPLGSISGRLLDDPDSDGQFDFGNQDRFGVTVYIDANDNHQLDAGEISALVDGGEYTFANLAPGYYLVREVMLPEYVQTFPVSNMGWHITLAPYENLTNADFFAHHIPTLITGLKITGNVGKTGFTRDNVFDGNLNTYYETTSANGSPVGLYDDWQFRLERIGFAPRKGYASRMVGGYFEATHTGDFTKDTVKFYTIAAAPAEGKLTYVDVPLLNVYRAVRYVPPAGSYGNVAELQFFN